MPVILSIDQGTTNTKAILVAANGDVLAAGSAPVGVTSPHPGWVEQDADRIWTSVIEVVGKCLAAADVGIVGLSLSTQRETVVGWQASTGEPIGPVIGWQDRRSADWCAEELDADDCRLVQERTALRVDPMFSAPKMVWILDHLPVGVPTDDVRLGTIDSWLIWRLTGGGEHLTDGGNASRTLLYDISALSWSEDLLAIFGVPPSALPEPVASDHGFGHTSRLPGVPDGTPILSVLADSHAALYGHGCTNNGQAKATYGTGSSVMTPVPTLPKGRLGRPGHVGVGPRRHPDVRTRGQHLVLGRDLGLGGRSLGRRTGRRSHS